MLKFPIEVGLKLSDLGLEALKATKRTAGVEATGEEIEVEAMAVEEGVSVEEDEVDDEGYENATIKSGFKIALRVPRNLIS